MIFGGSRKTWKAKKNEDRRLEWASVAEAQVNEKTKAAGPRRFVVTPFRDCGPVCLLKRRSRWQKNNVIIDRS